MCSSTAVCSAEGSTGNTLQLAAAVVQRSRGCVPVLLCVLHREALATDYTWRQLRLMFALSPWDRPMQYGQQAADEMQAKEALFKNFFQNVEVVMRQQSTAQTSKWAVSFCCCPQPFVPGAFGPLARQVLATACPLSYRMKAIIGALHQLVLHPAYPDVMWVVRQSMSACHWMQLCMQCPARFEQHNG